MSLAGVPVDMDFVLESVFYPKLVHDIFKILLERLHLPDDIIVQKTEWALFYLGLEKSW